MKIPVVVIDDSAADRYILKRRLARAEDFVVIGEFATGDTFLDAHFAPARGGARAFAKVLVMIDINLPRMSGFEIVEALQHRLAAPDCENSCVVLMCSTSGSVADRTRAAQYDLIEGYVTKPVSADCVDRIRAIYTASGHSG